MALVGFLLDLRKNRDQENETYGEVPDVSSTPTIDNQEQVVDNNVFQANNEAPVEDLNPAPPMPEEPENLNDINSTSVNVNEGFAQPIDQVNNNVMNPTQVNNDISNQAVINQQPTNMNPQQVGMNQQIVNNPQQPQVNPSNENTPNQF